MSRREKTLTIWPNDYIKTGDILSFKIDGRLIQGEVKSIEHKTVVIMNPTLLQRIKIWAQDMWLECQIKWWSRPKWLRF